MRATDVLALLFVMTIFTAPLWAVAGYAAGRRFNAPFTGFLLGLIFGPIGVIIAGFNDGRPQCAACRQRIERWASLCPYCHSRLTWDKWGHRASLASEAPGPAQLPVASTAAAAVSAPVVRSAVAPRLPLSHKVRTWTHVSGRKLEGRYVDAGAGRVRLAREDGQIVELPLEKLCDDDRALVEQELAHG